MENKSLNNKGTMSELISNVELKKSDDNPIEINCQFENGLPIKTFITSKWEYFFKNKN